MSTIFNIGIPGVGQGMLQPKQRNRWRVTFAFMGLTGQSQPVSMQAVSISRPTLDFAEVAIHRYNSVAYIAGKHSFNELSLTIEDDVTSSAAAVIQDQLQKQQWLIGVQGQWLASAGEGSIYKFATFLDTLDGNDQVTEKWIYEGCWIRSTNWGDLDYSSGDAVQIQMTLRYDNARQDIQNFGYTDGLGIATGGAGTIGGVTVT